MLRFLRRFSTVTTQIEHYCSVNTVWYYKDLLLSAFLNQLNNKSYTLVEKAAPCYEQISFSLGCILL